MAAASFVDGILTPVMLKPDVKTYASLTLPATDSLIISTPTLTLNSNINIFAGFYFAPTIKYSVGQISASITAFSASPTYQPMSTTADGGAVLFGGFFTQAQYNPTVAGAQGASLNGYIAHPQTTAVSGVATTLTSLNGVNIFPGLSGSSTVTGTAVTTIAGVLVNAPSIGGGGSAVTVVALDLANMSGATTNNLSLRSNGGDMRHLGSARFGSSTLSATGSSVLHVDGGFTGKRTTFGDTSYTALLTDFIIECTAQTALRTITLPTAASAGAGKIYILKKGNNSAFDISVAGNGAETVDGANPKSMGAGAFTSMRIYCTGTTWFTW